MAENTRRPGMIYILMKSRELWLPAGFSYSIQFIVSPYFDAYEGSGANPAIGVVYSQMLNNFISQGETSIQAS